ncbi:L-threonylcarbamoyladenylate synthase [Erythrobacter sp.]|jgi:L-threonylcarbamoyladenylate synthase|uniref:L-threonylcarbamoyladenylate synthase n=1 Tax=Erythrobacter sp. TaxID=1042 RepID=UPI002EB5E293|nr:L-threonylcarbamoyladenylate synthase [Erythrobacter sp.]
MSGKNAPHGEHAKLLVPDEGGIGEAAAILRSGGLVAVPTETVYGLAARADSAEAVARIYATKGRPDFNPLIVHVQGLDQAQRLARFDRRALDLAERFWPGPLTLVLPLAESASVAAAVTAGLPTIALRQPEHRVMQRLLERVGTPLAAPSANRSAELSPTQPDHVVRSLGDACPPLLDGGPCRAGLESTIVALRDNGAWSLLRPGPVTRETLARILGVDLEEASDGIEAPGQLARHYSPGKPIRLGAELAAPDEYLIGFGALAGDCTLSRDGDLSEAAARLYECLHRAAAAPSPAIAVAPIPDEGIGQAINDRLRRAASD